MIYNEVIHYGMFRQTNVLSMLKKVVSHDHINVDMLMHLSCSVGKVHVSRDKGLAPINVQ